MSMLSPLSLFSHGRSQFALKNITSDSNNCIAFMFLPIPFYNFGVNENDTQCYKQIRSMFRLQYKVPPNIIANLPFIVPSQCFIIVFHHHPKSATLFQGRFHPMNECCPRRKL